MWLLQLSALLSVMAPIAGLSDISCDTMQPNHRGTTPRTNKAPFTLVVSTSTYLPNSHVTVTLHGESASFEGFLLQARVIGDVTNNPVGTFSSPPSHTKLKSCQAEDDTLLHSDDTSQQEFSVMWNAPNKRVGDIEFIVTVVQSFNTYWMRITSAILVPDMTSGSLNTFGTDFILTFIGIKSEEPGPPELIFTTLESDVDVTVEVPSLSYKKSLKVSSSSAGFRSLSLDVRMLGTGKSNNGVLITASAEISVYGINKGLYSTDGFLALPMDTLGKEYYAISYTPEGDYAELGIVATKNNTMVHLVLPVHGNLRIEYKGKTYLQGEIIVVALDRLESFQLQTSSDLTGMHIFSNELIAAYSGHRAMVVGIPGTQSDHSVVQLLPVSRWGKKFAVTSFPGRSNGDIIRLVTSVDDTTLTIDGTETVLRYSGSHHDITLPSGSSIYFTTDKPVMVIQFGQGQDQNNPNNGDITTALVPSTDQYQSEYKFASPDASEGSFVNNAMVMVLKTEQDKVFIDAEAITNLGEIWQPILRSSPPMVAKRIQVTSGQHRMYMKDSMEKFGVILFGYTTKESYSFPGAMGMEVLNPAGCVPLPAQTDDGIDNDCDGSVDEEICDNIDNDGDGIKDEDCHSTSGRCTLNYQGKEFVLMFTENIAKTEDLTLFISSPSSNEVIVTIETPEFGTKLTKTVILYPRRTEVVTLPKELQGSGTALEKKGIHVRSTEDIVVYGVNSQQGSCGAFNVMPVIALGYNYFVMSWWPDTSAKNYGQIGIVAAEDVRVRVVIPHSKGIVFTYNGVEYNENKPMEFQLKKFETMQIQNVDFADISGTKIEADHKVAVFSGVLSTNIGSGNVDHVVEQMIPIHAAGKTFGLVPFPNQVTGYRIRVMSVLPDTSVNIGGNKRSLGLAGQYADHSLRSAKPVGISADKPVIVAQFSESQSSGTPGGPSMVLVPPTQQYRNAYTFMVPMPSTMYNSSYLLLIIEAGQENQIIMDGNHVRGQRLDITNTSPHLVGVTASLSSGRHHIYHQFSEVKFGLYLYGTARGTCAFSFVAGMCLEDIRQVLTTPASTSTTTASTTTTTTTTTSTTTTTTPTATTTSTPITSTPSRPTTTTTVTTTTVPTTTTVTRPVTTTAPPAISTTNTVITVPSTKTTTPSGTQGGCKVDYLGRKFVLMFIENAETTENMQLFISSTGDRPASVEIDATAHSSKFHKTVNVPSGQTQTVNIPKELQASGVAVEHKGIYVSASEDIVVLGFTKHGGSCGGFKVMPLDALGFNYYAMAWWPDSAVKNFGEIGIVATEDQTRVQITILRTKGVTFMYNGNSYNEDTPIEITLNQYDTFQLQNHKFSDITGTKIEADKRVAVFSGMLQTNVGGGDVDLIVEQMPTVHSWGKSFGVVPFPDQTSGYFVKIVGALTDTIVHINEKRYDIANPGEFIEHSCSQYIGITANKPIMVAQILRSQSEQQSGAPSMVMVPPTEQYMNHYVFSVPGGTDYHAYILLVARHGETDRLLIDGVAVSGTWQNVPDSTPALVGIQLPLTAGLHIALLENSGVGFGAVVYGYGNAGCAFTYHAGMCLTDITNVSVDGPPSMTSTIMTSPPLSKPTTKSTTPQTTLAPTTKTMPTTISTQTVPPTTVTTTTRTTTVTTPHMTTKVVAPEIQGECALDYGGREFVLMFPETVDGSDLKLFIISQGNHPAAVTISSPLLNQTLYQRFTIRPAEPKTVLVPSALQASGIGGSRKGIRISATDDIEVLAFSGATGSCGAFNVIPVDALGYNYHAMTWWPEAYENNVGQIGVVATEENTRVQFNILPSKGVSFTYNGDTYDETTSSLEVMLNRYETFQLQTFDASDITGTKIQADKKIAVFSGMKQTNVGEGNVDHVVEQMTPIHAWGQMFGVFPYPHSKSGYHIKVVSNTDDTVVYVDGIQHTISKAGGFFDMRLRSLSPIAVNASKPIMVALFSDSVSSGDIGAPSMVLISPVEQFKKNKYTYSLPRGTSIQTFVQLIAVKDTWDQPNFISIPHSYPQLAGFAEDLVSGSAYSQKDAKFGGYVQGNGARGCSVAYQLGACLTDIRELTSTTVLTTIATIKSTPETQTTTKSTLSTTPGVDKTKSTTMSRTQTDPSTTTMSTTTTATTPPMTTSEKVTAPEIQGECVLDYGGREFVLMFPETVDGSDLKLFIISQGNHPAAVTISSPLLNQTLYQRFTIRPAEPKTVLVPSTLQASGIGGSRKGIRISATDDIEVLAFSGATGSCGAFNVIPVDALGYNYYAMTWWPEAYENNVGQIGVVATEDNTRVQFNILPSKGVSFTYNGDTYDETTSSLEVMLNRYETFQLQTFDASDITGTKIQADKKIAVFSGMKQTNVGEGNVDHVVEQMTPIHAWGQMFGVFPYPHSKSGYHIKVVSNTDDTVVYVDGIQHTISKAGGFFDMRLRSLSPIAVNASKPIMVALFSDSVSSGDIGAPSMVLISPVEQFKKNKYTYSLPRGTSIQTFVQLIAVKDTWDQPNFISIPHSYPQLVGIADNLVSGSALSQKDAKFGGYVQGNGARGCSVAYQLGACLTDIRESSLTTTTTAQTAPTVITTPGIPTTSKSTSATTPGISTTSKSTSATTPGISTTSKSTSATTPGISTTLNSTSATTPGIQTTPKSTPTISTTISTTTVQKTAGPTTPGIPAIKPTTGGPVSTPACPEGQITADPKSCKNFYVCKDEILKRFTCPLDYHFSISDFTCLKPRDAGCKPTPGLTSGGKEYVIQFMANPSNDKVVELLINTASLTPVNVRVTTPPSSTPAVNRTVTVRKGETTVVTLPADIRSASTGRGIKAILLRADGDIIVTTINHGSCGSKLALPTQGLGTEYYAMTWAPAGGVAQVTALAITDDTEVTIVIGGVVDVSVSYESRSYTYGEVITIKLAMYESVVLESGQDLSGTKIMSSKPIVVSAGNTDTTIGSGTLSDQLVSQMTPVNTWGRTFALTPLPGSLTGYFVKILASTTGTVVHIHGHPDEILGAGKFVVIDIASNEPTWISSTAPILVVQYAKSETSADDLGAPASLLVPPISQFLSDYFFSVPQVSATTKRSVLIVSETSTRDGLLLQGAPLSTVVQWRDIAGSTPAMSVAIVPVSELAYVLRHRSDVSFGAYVYGADSGNCAYAFPAGMNLVSNPEPVLPTSTAKSTEGPVAETSGPGIISTVKPTTSEPRVDSTIKPTTSGPRVDSTITPTTSGPRVDSTIKPTTSGPRVDSTIKPTTSGPRVVSTTKSTTSGPRVVSTIKATTPGPRVVSTPKATTPLSVVSTTQATTFRPGVVSTIRTSTSGVFSTRAVTRKVNDPTPTREFMCPDGSAAYYEDPYSCSRFYQCADGVSHSMACPSGLHFSAMVANCLPPNEAGCEPSTEQADNLGRTFYLLFLATEPANTQDVQVLLTTLTSQLVDVNITAPQFFRSVTVKKGQVKTVSLPASLRSSQSGRVNKTVRVMANGEVSVSALNRGSCGNFLVLPLLMLGDTYYVMTWKPASGSALVSILAVEEDTAVRVIVGGADLATIEYEGTVYKKGETLQVTLKQFESLVMQSRFDLTGTHITGSKPLAVYAGNTETTIGSGSLPDQLVSQFTPVNTWGYRFALAPFPGSTSGYYIKYLTQDVDTIVTVTTSSGPQSHKLNSGEYFVVDITSSELVWIESTNQILVVQYAKSQTDPTDLSAPAALLVPPVEQYMSDYLFTVPAATSIYVMIVIEKMQLTGLLLDGLPVNASAGWDDIPNSEPQMASRYVSILAGAHRLRHRITNVTFGAYVYGFTPEDCAYANPAGMTLHTINKTVHTTMSTTSYASPSANTSWISPNPTAGPDSTQPRTAGPPTVPSSTDRQSSPKPTDRGTFATSTKRVQTNRLTTIRYTAGPTTKQPQTNRPTSPASKLTPSTEGPQANRPSSSRPTVRGPIASSTERAQTKRLATFRRTAAPTTKQPRTNKPRSSTRTGGRTIKRRLTTGPQTTKGPSRTTIYYGTVRPTISDRLTTVEPTRQTATGRPTRRTTTTETPSTTIPISCPCTKLTVKSTKLQPSFAGQYSRLSNPFNGRPAYKHNSRSHFLYLVNEQTKFWLFGTELGKNRGLILAHSDAEEPSTIKTTWRSYDSSDMTWKDDDTVSLQCDCQAATCEKLTIGGHMFYNSIPGEFTLLGNDFNERPSYKNNARGLYFYYYADSSDQFWVVGTKLGAKVGLVFNYDSATNPRLISATWVSLQEGHWVADPDVQLHCV